MTVLDEIKAIKKIEFHRHIEGCITPDFFHNLVKKYNPSHLYAEYSEIEKLYSFQTFMGFLNAFGIVVSFIRELDDLKELSNLVINQMNQENIKYAELIFSPQNLMRKKISLEEIVSTLHKSFRNTPSTLIIDIVRNYGVKEGRELLKQITPEFIDEYGSWLKAISIGGDEANYPPKLFTEIFLKARKLGLHTYAHAGEIGPSNNVWDAIQLLGVKRIGHGVKSINDPFLLEYIKNQDICLDISVTSNYLTGAVQKDHPHPLKRFMDLNIPVSINTDDPGFFKTNLNNEYMHLVDLGISLDKIKELSKKNLQYSLLDREQKIKIKKYL